MKVIKPAMPTIKQLWECDDEDLQERANSVMTSLGAQSGDILGDDIDTLIEQYINGEQPMLAGMISTLSINIGYRYL